jgi:hypothetical protein
MNPECPMFLSFAALNVASLPSAFVIRAIFLLFIQLNNFHPFFLLGAFLIIGGAFFVSESLISCCCPGTITA